MEYFLKDSYHTLLWRLGSAFSPVHDIATNRDSLISHKILVPSLLLASYQSLLVLRSHDVPLSIKFFSFALLKLSRFRSNPLVSGNCLKVSVMKGNFT